MSLEPLRARIDEIDASLLRLFQERMDVSAQIAAQKRRDGLPVYDAARERAKAKAFHDAARPPYGPYAQELYASLCALSRRYQRCLATPLRAGLLGRTLQHSFSPLIHSFFGDYSYDLLKWSHSSSSLSCLAALLMRSTSPSPTKKPSYPIAAS